MKPNYGPVPLGGKDGKKKYNFQEERESSIECKVLKLDYENHISWCRKCSGEIVESIIKRVKEGK